MRKLIIIPLLLAVAFGCQQKQEPKGQAQYPVQYPGGGQPGPNPMQAENEIRILQEAVKAEPRNVEAWIKLGNVLMDTSRFGEAADAYQKALALDSKNVDVRVDMGTCYKQLGKPEKAVEEYRKAISINPNHLNAHRNLGVVLAYDLAGDVKSRGDSMKELEKYLELAPGAPDAAQIRQMIADMKAKK